MGNLGRWPLVVLDRGDEKFDAELDRPPESHYVQHHGLLDHDE